MRSPKNGRYHNWPTHLRRPAHSPRPFVRDGVGAAGSHPGPLDMATVTWPRLRTAEADDTGVVPATGCVARARGAGPTATERRTAAARGHRANPVRFVR